jgi:hypothetical protein
MTGGADLYDQLRPLEESLWRAQTRFNREYMDNIFSPDFFEFGRSGRVYYTRERRPLGFPPRK